MYDYDYAYDYGFSDYGAFAGLLGGIAIFVLILFLIGLAVWIINIVSLWKIYKKAGKKGWESLIPFYSQWVLFEISGLNWWWFLIYISPILLSFIPIVNALGGLASLFAMFNCYYNLSKKFSKDTGFAICLTLFNPICIPILGLSKKNVYNSNVTVSNNGVFENDNTNTTNQGFNNQDVHPNTANYTAAPVNHAVHIDSSPQQVVDIPTSNIFDHGFSFCGNCGTKLSAEMKFCPNCGQKKM